MNALELIEQTARDTGAEPRPLLPQIVEAADFVAREIPRPPQLIAGVLHKGEKAIYGGPSASFKTWTMMQASLCVANGIPFLGYDTTRGRVLYLNFELPEYAVHERIRDVAKALGAGVRGLDLWNLRGRVQSLPVLLAEMKAQGRGEAYDLIIPDPIYKVALLGGRSENDADAVAAVCAEIESLAVETGAAVLFAAHFAKGNASAKDALDRVSGSGVWARDPDTRIVATPHEQDEAFTVEITPRTMTKPPPFVMRREHPLMVRADELDPGKLRQKPGRPAKHSAAHLLELLTPEGLPTAEWQRRAHDEAGISRARFYAMLRDGKGRLFYKSPLDERWRAKS